MPSPQVSEIVLSEVDQPTALAIGALVAEVFPRPGVTPRDRADQLIALGRDYTGPPATAPRSYIVREGSQVVAHAQGLPRTIEVATGELLIVGLARVATHPNQRGRGLGELVVRAVFALVDRGDFDASIFQTSHAVRPFYQRLGCASIENPIVNSLADDPYANPFRDEVVMRYPATSSWPEGLIDMRGPGY